MTTMIGATGRKLTGLVGRVSGDPVCICRPSEGRGRSVQTTGDAVCARVQVDVAQLLFQAERYGIFGGLVLGVARPDGWLAVVLACVVLGWVRSGASSQVGVHAGDRGRVY
jgi:hypothetical protein